MLKYIERMALGLRFKVWGLRVSPFPRKGPASVAMPGDRASLLADTDRFKKVLKVRANPCLLVVSCC